MLFIKADKSDYLLVSIKEDVGNGSYYDRNQFYICVLVCDFILLFEGCSKSRQNYGSVSPWRGGILWEPIRKKTNQRSRIKQKRKKAI
jgi:hypothetical protein